MTENRRIALNTLATYGRSLFTLACSLFTSRWILMTSGHFDYVLATSLPVYSQKDKSISFPEIQGATMTIVGLDMEGVLFPENPDRIRREEHL